MNSFKPKKIVTYWLYLGIVLVLAMVVIGGITRLTNSGLSMTHWTFTGSLPPLNEDAWNVEFERYKTSPEYIELHNHFEIEDFKSIYWWEFIHRMFGRMIGIIFIVPFVFFLWKHWISRTLYVHFIVILALGGLQGLLGWFMVQSGLIDVPRVSHYRLAAHLTTAFIACAYIYWVALRYQYLHMVQRSRSSARPIFYMLFILVFVQVIMGAFVAGLKAGWVHNTWPLMDEALIAPGVFALEPWWINFLEGKSGVQFAHRTLGVLLLIFTVYIYLRSGSFESKVSGAMRLTGAMIIVQFVLGVTTLLMEVPIFMGVIHQVFALIVVLSIIRGIYFSTFRLNSKLN